MLTYLTLGFAAFAVALVVLTLVNGFKFYKAESFVDVDPTAFKAKVTPGDSEGKSVLAPGAAFDPQSEKLLALPIMDERTANANWGKMTSETCFRTDISESLKLTRNYLQRTNNYQHTYPDSCTAPNHEFVGTFYTPFDGVGRTPPSGANYPASVDRRDVEYKHTL